MRVRRLLPVLLLLLLASTATAATIHGSKRGELVLGTPHPDRLVAAGGNDLVQAAFGGTQAVAGFDAGDMVHYAMIPGSRTAGISTALCTGSNITPPDSGVWRWSVRGGRC